MRISRERRARGAGRCDPWDVKISAFMAEGRDLWITACSSSTTDWQRAYRQSLGRRDENTRENASESRGKRRHTVLWLG